MLRLRTMDFIIAGIGAAFSIIGIFQLIAPDPFGDLTGLGAGIAAGMFGLLWVMLGCLLIIGVMLHPRAIAIFGCFGLLMISGCAIMVILWRAPSPPPLIFHIVAATSAIFAGAILYLAERADLHRELLEMKAFRRPAVTAESEA